MENLLFPTDFSKAAAHAMDFAIYLAQANDSALTILHVYGSPYVDPYMSPETIGAILRESHSQSETDLKNLKEELAVKHPWLKVSTRVEHGFVVEATLQVAEEINCDYIIMGTKGASGILDKIIGSNTFGVIEKSKCPVWSIPITAHIKEFKTVMYATDYSGDEVASIQQILNFSKLVGAETKVIHFHELFEPNISDADKVAKTNLQGRFKGENISFINLTRLDTNEGIEQYIENQNPNVLALAMHRRGFWSNLFHSSTTRHFALTSKIPVLAIHK
ncbi:MAG: universal stress protein [Bacteroidota bacterium]|nr:universal stress protein [Bacteroidota bacterium]